MMSEARAVRICSHSCYRTKGTNYIFLVSKSHSWPAAQCISWTVTAKSMRIPVWDFTIYHTWIVYNNNIRRFWLIRLISISAGIVRFSTTCLDSSVYTTTSALWLSRRARSDQCYREWTLHESRKICYPKTSWSYKNHHSNTSLDW